MAALDDLKIEVGVACDVGFAACCALGAAAQMLDRPLARGETSTHRLATVRRWVRAKLADLADQAAAIDGPVHPPPV